MTGIVTFCQEYFKKEPGHVSKPGTIDVDVENNTRSFDVLNSQMNDTNTSTEDRDLNP